MVVLGWYEYQHTTYFVLQNTWESKPFVSVSMEVLTDSKALIYFNEGQLAALDKDRRDFMTNTPYADCAMQAGPDVAELPDGAR
eukprot:3492832-Amphidinium_carterae.1